MSTYLVIKNGTMTKSYACKESASTPYLKVSNSYLPLTTETGTGLHVKASGSTFIPVESKATTLTTTITKYYRDYGESNSTSIIHSSSLNYFSASKGNCYEYYTSKYTLYEYYNLCYRITENDNVKVYFKPVSYSTTAIQETDTRLVMYSSDGWNVDRFPTGVINNFVLTNFMFTVATYSYTKPGNVTRATSTYPLLVHSHTSLNKTNAPLAILNTSISYSSKALASTRNYLSSSVVTSIAFAINGILLNTYSSARIVHDIMRINQAATSRAINRSLDVTTFSASITYMTNFSSVTDYGESISSSDEQSVTYIQSTTFNSNGDYNTTSRVIPIISSNNIVTNYQTMTKSYTTSTLI